MKWSSPKEPLKFIDGSSVHSIIFTYDEITIELHDGTLICISPEGWEVDGFWYQIGEPD
jgi:hypothetical protein